MLGITREGQEQADSLSAMIQDLLKEAENHPKEKWKPSIWHLPQIPFPSQA